MPAVALETVRHRGVTSKAERARPLTANGVSAERSNTWQKNTTIAGQRSFLHTASTWHRTSRHPSGLLSDVRIRVSVAVFFRSVAIFSCRCCQSETIRLTATRHSAFCRNLGESPRQKRQQKLKRKKPATSKATHLPQSRRVNPANATK